MQTEETQISKKEKYKLEREENERVEASLLTLEKSASFSPRSNSAYV